MEFIKYVKLSLSCFRSKGLWIFAFLCLIFVSSFSLSAQVTAKDKVEKSAQSFEVKGIVKDSKGEPLAGVFVRVKNSSFGTSTGFDGTYSIKLTNPKTILIFSMVGMQTVERVVGDKREINVILNDAVNELNSVVVTGIFTKNKESYTGSVSTITNKELKMYRGQNLLQTLRNVDASLNMPASQEFGSDPNRLPQINIRGDASLPLSISDLNNEEQTNVNQPLIIMDGFEVPLRTLMDFNDEEIESINILKDASATSIYGSRAANGVIVIVTKEPTAGSLRVQASVGLNIELPDLSSYNMLHANEKLELEKLVGIYKTTEGPNAQAYLDNMFQNRLKSVLSGIDVDWLAIPLRNGVGQRYNARLDGGSRTFRWAVGLNYNKVNGVMKGSSRDNMSGDITIIYNRDNLIFRNYTNISASLSSESKYGSFANYVTMQPYDSPYNPDGSFRRFFDVLHNEPIQNPLWDTRLNIFDKNSNKSVTNNFSVDWTILEGLRLRGQASLSYSVGQSDAFLPAGASKFQREEYKTAEGRRRRGSYDFSYNNALTLEGTATLSYNKVIADKHNLYFGLNLDVNQVDGESYGLMAEGFPNEDLYTLDNALQYPANGKPRGTRYTTRRIGITSNFTYTYNNRYFIDASYRLDGSSEFGSKNRFAPFWSFGLGWNVHNESFFKDNNYVNLLRFKASVGEVGALNFAARAVQTTYEYSSSYSYLDWNGAVLTGWGNPSLSWQKTTAINIGTEFGFFKNRFGGRLDIYNKTTSNLLSAMQLPPSMGFTSYTANVGSVINNGAELYLNAFLIRDYQHDFRWQIGAQLTYNSNKIGKLSPAIKAQNDELMRKSKDISRLLYEGMPLNSIYGVRSLGIDPSFGNEVYLTKNGTITDKLNVYDKVYLGRGDQPFRGIANTMIYWKGLSFNISFSYYWGGLIYNQTLKNRVEVPISTIMTDNVDRRVFDQRWKVAGDHVVFGKYKDVEDNMAASSRFVQEDAVFNISSMNLQYRWESKWLKDKAHIRAVSFNINASNLATFSKVRVERGRSYPFSRTIMSSIMLYF